MSNVRMQQALNSILEAGFASAAHATLLALVVLVVTRVWRNAQVAHLLHRRQTTRKSNCASWNIRSKTCKTNSG